MIRGFCLFELIKIHVVLVMMLVLLIVQVSQTFCQITGMNATSSAWYVSVLLLLFNTREQCFKIIKKLF